MRCDVESIPKVPLCLRSKERKTVFEGHVIRSVAGHGINTKPTLEEQSVLAESAIHGSNVNKELRTTLLRCVEPKGLSAMLGGLFCVLFIVS